MREFSQLNVWATDEVGGHLGLLQFVLTWSQVERLSNLTRRALVSGRADGDFRRVVYVRPGTLALYDGRQFATSTLVCRATRAGALRITGTSRGRTFVAPLGHAETFVRAWSDGRSALLSDYLNGRLSFPLSKERSAS